MAPRKTDFDVVAVGYQRPLTGVDKESLGRHLNELVRMQDTNLFKELKLSGFRVSLSRRTVPSLDIYEGSQLVGGVEPIVSGNRTWWVVEDLSKLSYECLGDPSVTRTRYGSWEEVEEAVYSMAGRGKGQHDGS